VLKAQVIRMACAFLFRKGTFLAQLFEESFCLYYSQISQHSISSLSVHTFCMKKLFLSLGLVAGVASAASAQEARYGLKAGVGLSNVTGADASENTKNLFGFQAGVMADFSLSELISLHPELLYSQKGVKSSFADSYTTGGYTYTANSSGQARLSYLDLPVLLRLKASGAFFEVGPQLGFLLGQKATYTKTTSITTSAGIPISSGSDNYSDNSTDGLRKVDFGYVLGVGYRLPQGLELGLRYNGGFSSLDDSSNSASKVRNSVFQLQVGYLFGGK
jgi:hypothetical protein